MSAISIICSIASSLFIMDGADGPYSCFRGRLFPFLEILSTTPLWPDFIFAIKAFGEPSSALFPVDLFTSALYTPGEYTPFFCVGLSFGLTANFDNAIGLPFDFNVAHNFFLLAFDMLNVGETSFWAILYCFAMALFVSVFAFDAASLIAL